MYDEITGILKEAGKVIVEFPGIMPNPTYAKVQEGAKLARENHADMILAVGGGSTMDCCKGQCLWPPDMRGISGMISGHSGCH